MNSIFQRIVFGGHYTIDNEALEVIENTLDEKKSLIGMSQF